MSGLDLPTFLPFFFSLTFLTLRFCSAQILALHEKLTLILVESFEIYMC